MAAHNFVKVVAIPGGVTNIEIEDPQFLVIARSTNIWLGRSARISGFGRLAERPEICFLTTLSQRRPGARPAEIS